MKEKVLVSVVVAVYNMEKYLQKCIDSVLNQSYQYFELVLVNDGSVDSSEAIIDSNIAANPDRIRKINKTNGGLASARNISLDKLQGKYVTFLDADDYYDREYLEKLVGKAEKEGLDMVCSGQHKITEDGVILKTIHWKTRDGQCLQRRLNIAGKLYRTEYILKWGITFPYGKLYEDNSFNLQAMFLTDRVGFVDYEGYYQVVHEGSITAKPIDVSKLPFDERERCAKRIHEESVPGVDIDLFDLTFMSFLTYFLIVRNRKREYLTNENKGVSMECVYRIAEVFEGIVNEQFAAFGSNKYLKLLMYKDLPITQKLGSKVFWWFSRRKKLKLLVKMAYSIL